MTLAVMSTSAGGDDLPTIPTPQRTAGSHGSAAHRDDGRLAAKIMTSSSRGKRTGNQTENIQWLPVHYHAISIRNATCAAVLRGLH